VQLPHLSNDDLNGYLNTFLPALLPPPPLPVDDVPAQLQELGNIMQSVRKVNVLWTK